MNEKSLLNNIRKTHLKKLPWFLIFGIILNFMFIGLIITLVEGDTDFLNDSPIFGILFMGAVSVFAIITDIEFVKTIILIFNPLKDNVFKKYGSKEKIVNILNEIDKNREYEDKVLIISDKYICGKKELGSIISIDNILGIHKYVHKTNFIVDYYGLTVVDKYNERYLFRYNAGEEKTVDDIILLLSKKCKNAKVGYTPEEWDHINNNKQDLPEEIPEDSEDKKNEKAKKNSKTKNNTSEKYGCPECNTVITKDDKVCPKCGVEIDWSDDEDEAEYEEGPSNIKEIIMEVYDDCYPKWMFEHNDAFWDNHDNSNTDAEVQKISKAMDDTSFKWNSIILKKILKNLNISNSKQKELIELIDNLKKLKTLIKFDETDIDRLNHKTISSGMMYKIICYWFNYDYENKIYKELTKYYEEKYVINIVVPDEYGIKKDEALKCKKCGAVVDKEDVFCKKCGEKLK